MIQQDTGLSTSDIAQTVSDIAYITTSYVRVTHSELRGKGGAVVVVNLEY